MRGLLYENFATSWEAAAGDLPRPRDLSDDLRPFAQRAEIADSFRCSMTRSGKRTQQLLNKQSVR